MNKVRKKIDSSISVAAESIPKTWPLYAFVTSNPLAGLENLPFEEAVARAQKLFGANAYPSANCFRQAWERKEIRSEILTELLEQNGLLMSPEASLKEMEALSTEEKRVKNPNHELDRLTVKWLSVFLDQGLSEWDMPEREKGFYAAWLSLAPYDKEIPASRQLSKLAGNKFEALESLLQGYEQERWENIFEYQLAALPGWTGFIKHRLESHSEWQQSFPVSLADYLAVRLALARQLSLAFEPANGHEVHTPDFTLPKIWLKAWEFSFQKQFMKSLEWNMLEEQEMKEQEEKPEAQLVFCIDTRSELIRRHVEQAGNYETFGYAGFFGIPMDYQAYDSGLSRKSCPPILASAYQVSERPKENEHHQTQKYHNYQTLVRGAKNLLSSLKKNIPASFGFVEGAGAFYGFSLLSRTLSPKAFYRLGEKLKSGSPVFESFCEPVIKPICKTDAAEHGLAVKMSLEEKVAIAKGAFNLMGWREFAPLVAFIGHGSHTTNNPFGSSLDCGACAASPGRHNARVLAMLCNLAEVRTALKKDHDIHIPSGTVFLGGEHNTTTDEMILFEDHVPETHHKQLKKLKRDLAKAKSGATAERLGMQEQDGLKSIRIAEKKASDWAETRPEWGLASNAAFIIGSRKLSRNLNLQGRSFLHSYDWQLDPEGLALEGIMQGPVTVTQWINNHYYFSTVDNMCFGSGSKITQNITGKFGVVQGNGGDLKAGLPLQSLKKDDEGMYHQPLRLTVMIHAPLSRVKRILADNKQTLTRLFENEWIYLTVMDPEKENTLFKYLQGGRWQAQSSVVNELEGISPSLAQKAPDKKEISIN
jgi:uncharacterized protein YbcC (UPF0753/DUF2309 family)